jgi:hypothetical protein
MTKKWREVRLPVELCEAAERQYADQYASLEELLTFMLSYVTRKEAERMDQAELEIVQQRLRDLGYV